MRFHIDGAEVKLANYNPRIEKHGPDDVPALDLKLIWDAPNIELGQFHPDLLEALYAPDAGAQKRLASVPPILPHLVFADMEPIKWASEASGLTLTIDHGLGGGSDLVIADASADTFVIEPLDGGTIRITFRLRAVCEDEHTLGRLPLLTGRTLPMRVVQREIDGEEEEDDGDQDDDDPPQRSIEDAFASTAGS